MMLKFPNIANLHVSLNLLPSPQEILTMRSIEVKKKITLHFGMVVAQKPE
jgi:hypothetical protein